MPALAHLEVTIQVWELGGAASIGAATALTQMRLFESYRLPDEDPDEEHATWPLELLRSLPSSLRVLSGPSWSSELAEAVGGLTQLRALSVAYHGEEPMIPSVEAPLWPFLQALHIPTKTVPQVRVPDVEAQLVSVIMAMHAHCTVLLCAQSKASFSHAVLTPSHYSCLHCCTVAGVGVWWLSNKILTCCDGHTSQLLMANLVECTHYLLGKE